MRGEIHGMNLDFKEFAQDRLDETINGLTLEQKAEEVYLEFHDPANGFVTNIINVWDVYKRKRQSDEEAENDEQEEDGNAAENISAENVSAENDQPAGSDQRSAHDSDNVSELFQDSDEEEENQKDETTNEQVAD